MSLKGDQYENLDEIRFRLNGTVVLYDGHPVYIQDVVQPDDKDEGHEIARVMINPLPIDPQRNKAAIRKYISSRKFDITPFPLGFCKNEETGKIVYLYRLATRQNRQGLSGDCLAGITLRGEKSKDLSFRNLIYSKSFCDTILGNFKSFKECLGLLTKENTQEACSRTFALEFDVDVGLIFLYKVAGGIIRKVGYLRQEDNIVNITSSFDYLREDLTANNIPYRMV